MTKEADPNPNSPAVPTTKGAPKARFKTAYQVWQICRDLERDDRKRKRKRARIYKAYNRFPPSEYSKLWKEGQEWQSNCNFGMMAYVVDNTMSSFYDMVTERVLVANIRTKKGKPQEKATWSKAISYAFDKVVREWDDYLLNVEQDTLDMLLYGKGVQLKEDEEGLWSEHISADDIIVPDGTKLSLKNFDMALIRRRYQLHELWEKIDEVEGSEGRGWHREAVLSAMRYQRQSWADTYKDNTEYAKAVNEGNETLGGHLKEHVDCYMLLAKEFDGTISKYIVLRDYGPIISLTRKKERPVSQDKDNEKTVINKEGFLFDKQKWAEEINDVMQVFIDNSGQGMWYATPSLGEKIFVQCRQYDFTMNAIMDAIKVNMSLMLQASTSDASEKIKSLVFGPYTIIPSDVPFVQQRLALPTQEATNALQFMMLDMFRGIGEYRINEQSKKGTNRTATESQIDATEAAKLQNTQLKRFNAQHTRWYRATYKRLVNLGSSEKDYKHLEKFKDYLKEYGVPKSAWEWDGIDCIESNMLAGAGSPSYKLMAAEKTIALTNISPRGQAQANAVEDAIAALHGRENVARYTNNVQADLTFDERIAHYENMMLGNILCNPADIQVMPEQDDVYHLETHMSDMSRSITLVNELIKAGKIPETMSDSFMFKMINQGSHCEAHLQKLSADEGKEDQAKMAQQNLANLQKAAEQTRAKLDEIKKSAAENFDPSQDPDIAKEIAISQIKIKTAETMSNISLGAQARKHEQRIKVDQEKAANDIAITRAKAEGEKKTAANKPKPPNK